MPGSGEKKKTLKTNEGWCQPALPLWRQKDSVYFTVALTSCKDNILSPWKIQFLENTKYFSHLSMQHTVKW